MRRVLQVLMASACCLVASPGVGAERSVGDLVKQLADKEPEKACAAAKALGQRGAKEALPALKELCKSRHSRIKWSAAEAVWRLEHKAAEVAPIFAELLAATDPDVRAASAWRLGRLDVDRATVLLLASALSDKVLEVRVQAGLALANLGRHAEPALPALLRAFRDRRLDEVQQVHQSWTATTSPALPALVELADEALPLLLDALRDKAVARRFAHVLPAFGRRPVEPLVRLLKAKEPQLRADALFALRAVAKAHGLPDSATGEVEKCLNDAHEAVRSDAARVLAVIRPASAKAVAVLATASVDRADLLADLERMCPHNEAAVALLLRVLKEADLETSKEAYRILAKLEDPTERLLEALTKGLAHSDTEVRTSVLEALGRFGPQAKSAKAALHAHFGKESDFQVKSAILDALTRIDPVDPALLRLLLAALNDEVTWVRMKAGENVAVLGPHGRTAAAVLEAKLFGPQRPRDRENDVADIGRLLEAVIAVAPEGTKRATVLLKALRQRGIRSEQSPRISWYMRDVLEDSLLANVSAAQAGLRAALKDEVLEVRQSAALVLVRAGLDIDKAVAVLTAPVGNDKGLSEEQSRFQSRAVEYLMRRQHAGAPLIAAAWCKAWQSAASTEREFFEQGLCVFQAEALPHLLEQLRRAKSTQARRDLADLLARFEGQGKTVLPILREKLASPEPTAKYAAARSLWLLGPDAAEAMPELLRMLSAPDPGMRAVAAYSLGSIGAAARPAVPGLNALLKSDKLGLRLLAALALSRIDPSVSEALKVLRQAYLSPQDPASQRQTRNEVDAGLSDEQWGHEFLEEGLARFGERGVEVFAEALDKVDLDEWSATHNSAQCGAVARIQAALWLAQVGPEARSAVPALRRALKDRDPFLRDAAAAALGRIGAAAREAAPDLLLMLEQQHRGVSSAGTWSSLSGAAKLRQGSQEVDAADEFDFRNAGRRAVRLSKQGKGYYLHNPYDYSYISSQHPHDPTFVLSRIDNEAQTALPILRAMAKAPNHPGRLAAALALWRSGDGADDLVTAFTDTLAQHARVPIAEVAALPSEILDCLAEPDAPLKPAARVMSDWLKRRQATAPFEQQIAVATALGRCGIEARAAEEVLRSMLNTPSWSVERKVAVCLALYRITGNSKSALPILREVLLSAKERLPLYHQDDLTASPRIAAARALSVLADAGDETARRLLVETMKGDENPHVRLAALETTAHQQDTNAAAVRGLCALLRHPDAGVREATAVACGRLGKHAKAGAAAVKAATLDGHLAVRQAARLALELLD